MDHAAHAEIIYAACELIVGALILLAVVSVDHYNDSQKRRGPWGDKK